jgi:assimilatory nitrate reductase catalytic subunit
MKRAIAKLRQHALVKKAGFFVRRRDGKLTQDLVLHPGKFGLGKVPARLEPDDATDMVCGFCSTGCGLTIHLKDGQAINLSPATNYPVNTGLACPKGWEALTPLRAPDRATTPYLRNADGGLEAVDWHTALQSFTSRFKAIQDKYGKEAIAWLGSGQICTEELAFLGALAKFGLGILHGDGNTRQCMATAATAYSQSFGFDAPPYTYNDFEESDVLVFVGSNLCIAHPIMWQRVCRNKHRPEIIVVDPRKTETAMAATQHYAIRPKSDLILLYGLANRLIAHGWIDREYIDGHTSGFEAFADFVAQFTPNLVIEATGLNAEQLEKFAATVHRGSRVSFWWTMGVNQGHDATRTAQAIIDLALMTGNIGRPGTGANSITGQCNAMGSRLFSNTTNLLSGHDFLNVQHRAKIARILGIDIDRIPNQNSLAYDQIVEGIANDKIKGLWIVATNCSDSWINQTKFNEILEKLDFLVVQDMYFTTETARRAHLILPAAGWGEKVGTFINSERRIGLVKRVSRAPGQALSDFNIFKLIAQYWGCGKMFEKWSSPESVFQILKELSRGQPCEITGIRDYQMIDAVGGIQWPFLDISNDQSVRKDDPAQVLTLPVEPERRLFEDGLFYHSDKKARFLFETPRDVPEPTDEEYPFVLLTGRGTSSQWHTQTRTGKSAVLKKMSPEDVYVEMNAIDAATLGIETNQKVLISSRRGQVTATVFITNTVQAGQLFMPMHYSVTNALTFPAFDPYSRQPSYKACAVSVSLVRGVRDTLRGFT